MIFKKLTIFSILFVIAGVAVFGQAITIAQPAASVNLIKSEMISVQQLNAQVDAINLLRQRAGQQVVSASRADKIEILNMMISDLLLMQGAERDGIKAEQSEIDNAVNNQKAQFEQQKQRVYTLTEFKAEVKKETGYTWEKYTQQLEKQIVQQKYIMAKKQADIQKATQLPDNNDIESFYKQNRTQLSNPDMVRYSQIFISTLNLDYNKQQEAKKKADEAYRKYQNGTASFEQLVNDYTEDRNAKYRNGDSGYIAYSDPNATGYLGKSFMDSLFKIKQGDVAGVIKSNIGFHIIKVTEYREAKLLGLDDPVLPSANQTVREYIAQQLIVKAQNAAVSTALNSLVSDLKKDADIKIFEDNIN